MQRWHVNFKNMLPSLCWLEHALRPVNQLLYHWRPSGWHAKLHQQKTEQNECAVQTDQHANVACCCTGVKAQRFKVGVPHNARQLAIPACLCNELGSLSAAVNRKDACACKHQTTVLVNQYRTWKEKVRPVISFVIMASNA